MARRKAKGDRGGTGIGVGRPSLFRGKTEKMSLKVTPLALSLIDDTAARLEAEHGHHSQGDAVELLVRTATGTPLDADGQRPMKGKAAPFLSKRAVRSQADIDQALARIRLEDARARVMAKHGPRIERLIQRELQKRPRRGTPSRAPLDAEGGR